jgi:uncharacterized protein DUF4238
MVARRHHYVPKCYLESFASKISKKKNSSLWVFDAVDKKCFRTSPENIALQTDFNTIDLEGHEPDAFEKAMSGVESDIGPALVRIIAARSLKNDEDKTLLLNLVGLLHIRNPRLREQSRNFRERVAKVMMSMLLSTREMWDSHVKKAKEAGFIPKDSDTDYDKHKNMNPDDYRVEVANEAHIHTEMYVFDHSLPLLFERKWVLAKAPKGSPGFITSDHPVCLIWSEPTRRSPGLRLKGTEILFPISPELAVVGVFEREDDGDADFTEDAVAAFNGWIATQAQRHVYARTNDFSYQIDQKQPSKKATKLLGDPRFKPLT